MRLRQVLRMSDRNDLLPAAGFPCYAQKTCSPVKQLYAKGRPIIPLSGFEQRECNLLQPLRECNLLQLAELAATRNGFSIS